MRRRRLAEPGGLTPEGLVRVQGEPRSPDLPARKEVVIITRVEVFLGAGNGPKVTERLLKRRTRQRFEKTGESEGAAALAWLRPRLPGPAHVPAAAPGCRLATLFADPGSAVFCTFIGNRQCIGDIAFTDDRAESEAMTLSRAAVLLSRWKPACKGGPNHVTKVRPSGCGGSAASAKSAGSIRRG